MALFRECTKKNLLPGVLICRYFCDKARVRKTLSKDYSQQGRTLSLDQNVAIITGGAEGIGLAIAKVFLKCGLSGLAIADCSKEKGEESIKQLACEFGENKVLFFDGDMSQSKAFDRVFKETLKHFENVNIVVNNAGVMNDVNWECQVNTNMSSTIIGTLLGMQYMSKTSLGQGGTIINVASIMGLIPSSGYPIHTLTQFGIVGFSRAIGNLNHYDRTGVRVTALCPGLTNTKLLKQAPYHAINDKFRKEFKEESGGCVFQKPESVALAALDVLQDALPGSVWVVENNSKPYEIRFPEVADLRFKNKC
ncbi:15-hydroxyprostaglandin dehydrogenase [NAD(+)]-like isoform X1 [Tribolium madens]|uniref:15-hydroxyprostaglandin dehydrogenase [NAD(+)]-like isoform X1 n=1 Tax=Tribolium madens TaxID=41895 RepID=UPI001CF73116|nr:15-hydroxyprostaglandin dehydrogenase [NAD(+)]-like isoform X1 [Tribolium madens]